MHKFMEMIALESGEIPLESPIDAVSSVSGILVDGVEQSQHLGKHLDLIEEGRDLSVQLDALADHADAVARAEQTGEMIPDAVYVSTESMHREFQTIMRSVKLTFNASSFEAAGNNVDRLVGISRDARRVSAMAKSHNEELTDYTSEGAIWSFLRRDASKLEAARDELDKAGTRLARAMTKVSESPRRIKNQGFARFMTRRNKQVTDLVASIGSESKYLSSSHDQIESAVKALATMAAQLRSGQVLSAINSLGNARPFTGVSALGTEEGYLMGNNTIESQETEGVYPHLLVPKYTRSSGIRIKGKSIAWAAWEGLTGALAGRGIVGLVIIGGIVLGAPAVAVAVAASKTAIITATAVHGAVDGFNYGQDSSNTGSQATSEDLKKVVDMVSTYTRFTNYSVDGDLISANLKAARKNTDGMTDDQKKQLSEIVSALETSLDRLVRAAGILYEQSYYSTTLTAALITAVVNRTQY